MLRITLIALLVVNSVLGDAPNAELSVAWNSTLDTYDLVRGSTGQNGDVNRVGWSTFINNITATGWSILEVHTNPDFADQIQAYYAGLMEGVATQGLIKDHWTNTIGDYCAGQEAYCTKLQQFLQDNLDYMNAKVDAERFTDPYWHQVGLILEQIAGLEDGYNEQLYQAPHRNVSVFGLYLIDIFGDVEDLEVILQSTNMKGKRILGSGSCSALIKVLPGNEDIFASQVSWNDLVSMIRIQKHYNLGVHTLPRGGSLIPGQSGSFSSYPGTIQSGDDFYVLSSGLVTLETTIGNSNNSLYNGITADGIVLEWVRSIVANRLAVNGAQWADLFARLNSGTYNNQVIISLN